MAVIKYIMRGIAHGLVLFIEFIDFNSIFFYIVVILILAIFFSSIKTQLKELLVCGAELLKYPIVNVFAMIMLFFNVAISIIFGDIISFPFIIVTFSGFIMELYSYVSDTTINISGDLLYKETSNIIKSSMLLLVIKTIYMLDTWTFDNFHFLLIYPIYAACIILAIIIKKMILIVDNLHARSNFFGRDYSKWVILFLYLYTCMGKRSLNIATDTLLDYFTKHKIINSNKKILKQDVQYIKSNYFKSSI